MFSGRKIDPRVLKEFAQNERQHEIVDAVIDNGSANKAAKVLNMNRRSVDKMLDRLEGKAAKEGVAPHRDLTHQTAEGFQAKRISTAYKEDGSVALQWVIQEPDKQSLQQRLDFMLEGIKGDLTGFKKAVKAPKKVNSDYLAMYMVGDHHFGMLADSETKFDDDDWDVKIAT
jgi:hypothetical protein